MTEPLQGSGTGRPTEVQGDYTHWRRDHDLWDRDISRWQADHQQALLELEHIAQQFVYHGDALRHHAAGVHAHGESLGAMERSGVGATISQRTIDGLSTDHSRRSEVHERIRRHHENAMSLIRALSEALRSPI